MEMGITVASNAMKVGLQVISSHKRPNLEIYTEWVKNENFTGIVFYLVNIGGSRAEDVELTLSGDLDTSKNYPSIRNIGLFNNVIPSIAPSQTILLMRLQEFDLHDYEYNDAEGEEGTLKVGTAMSITNKTLKIEFTYNGENRGLNKICRWFLSIYEWFCSDGSKKQYMGHFDFVPQIFKGSYWPLEE